MKGIILGITGAIASSFVVELGYMLMGVNTPPITTKVIGIIVMGTLLGLTLFRNFK